VNQASFLGNREACGEVVLDRVDGEAAPAGVPGEHAPVLGGHALGVGRGGHPHGGEVGLGAPAGGPLLGGECILVHGRARRAGRERLVERSHQRQPVPGDEPVQVGGRHPGREVLAHHRQEAVEEGGAGGGHDRITPEVRTFLLEVLQCRGTTRWFTYRPLGRPAV